MPRQLSPRLKKRAVPPDGNHDEGGVTVDPASPGEAVSLAAGRLVLALLTGPAIALTLFSTGASLHLALLLGITGGWWALWMIPSLPIHFAPLLALLVLAMFSIEPTSSLMLGFGMDAFWWILGSWVLALAAWETGLIGVLFVPSKGPLSFLCRLLAGLAGLPGTRASRLLMPFAQRDTRAGYAGFHMGRMIGLPSHALNLFALALLPVASTEWYTLMNWLSMTLPTAVALTWLSMLLPSTAPVSESVHSLPSRDDLHLTSQLYAPVRVTLAQWLAALAISLAWLGAGLSTAHGLPSGMWFLYLGLMTIAAGLLPLDKFWRNIDWLLLLAFGIGIGLVKTVTGALAPLFLGFIEDTNGALHPLILAIGFIGLTTLGFRCFGLMRCALILLPLALALASALAGEPAGWLLMVLITLHWLDICNATPTGKPIVRHAVRLAGLGLIGITAAVWYRLELL